MAIAWATVQAGLFDAIKGAVGSGVTVGWAFAETVAPMPVKPCAILNLTSRDRAGGSLGATFDERQPTVVNGTFVYSRHRQHTLSVNIYSDTTYGDGHAMAIMGAVTRFLRLESTVLALRVAGCKLWQTGHERDLSALLDTRAESRAQCDFEVATLDTTTEAIGWIETVDLDDVTVGGLN